MQVDYADLPDPVLIGIGKQNLVAPAVEGGMLMVRAGFAVPGGGNELRLSGRPFKEHHAFLDVGAQVADPVRAESFVAPTDAGT